MDDKIIEIRNLSKVFDSKENQVVALNNINLTINKGDIHGIIGLSGAGKSTLIRCINYLEKPTTGSVLYKGTDLGDLKEKDLLKIRQKIGMIFQNFNLFEQKTVLKNVLFPLEISKELTKEERNNRAAELLKIVGLEDKINSYPAELSGGQKQRVAIARALANNPDLLLCDEATSALDPQNTDSILELLKNINQHFGITVIIITHEMRVIESICDKVSIIDKSTIVEEGLVSDIFVNPKTKIAKRLIFNKSDLFKQSDKRICLRLIFDGTESEAIISQMIMHTQVVVNIVNAEIKSVNGKAYGEMIIEVSSETRELEKVKNYLEHLNVTYQEVEDDN